MTADQQQLLEELWQRQEDLFAQQQQLAAQVQRIVEYEAATLSNVLILSSKLENLLTLQLQLLERQRPPHGETIMLTEEEDDRPVRYVGVSLSGYNPDQPT